MSEPTPALTPAAPEPVQATSVVGFDRKWFATLVAALVTGVVGLLGTSITAAVQRSQELQLATQKAQQEFQFKLLEKAIDPARLPADRLLVLRLLTATTNIDKDALHKWASSEQLSTEKELQIARERISQLEKTASDNEKRTEQIRNELTRAYEADQRFQEVRKALDEQRSTLGRLLDAQQKKKREEPAGPGLP